jgi:hypothetical protein
MKGLLESLTYKRMGEMMGLRGEGGQERQNRENIDN